MAAGTRTCGSSSIAGGNIHAWYTARVMRQVLPPCSVLRVGRCMSCWHLAAFMQYQQPMADVCRHVCWKWGLGLGVACRSCCQCSACCACVALRVLPGPDPRSLVNQVLLTGQFVLQVVVCRVCCCPGATQPTAEVYVVLHQGHSRCASAVLCGSAW
jgi:hypothetical protein